MKNVLLTGFARGIGRSIFDLIKTDVNIYGVCNNSYEKAQKLASKNVHIYKTDLSIRKDVDKLITDLKPIKFDHMIFNAGIAEAENINEFNIDIWDKVMQVNLNSVVQIIGGLSDNFVPSGSIVNIASQYGNLYGMQCCLAYSVSKAGLINLTKCLAKQFENKSIRVNCVAPSIVDTNMTSQDIEEMLSEVSRRTPIGRISKPEEIASIVKFLLSKEANYINGQVIVADGGYCVWDGIY